MPVTQVNGVVDSASNIRTFLNVESGAQPVNETTLRAGGALLQPDFTVYGTLAIVSSDSSLVPLLPGTDGQVLKLEGGIPRWLAHAGGLTAVVDDLTPQLGGNLDVNGKTINSVSNGVIAIQPNGSGALNLATTGTGVATIGNATGGVTVGGNMDMSVKNITNLGTSVAAAGALTISTASNGALAVQPNGTGALNLGTTGTGVTTIGNTTGLVLLGGDLQVNGKSIVSISNGAIAVQPHGTGALNLATTGTGIVTIGNATGGITAGGALNMNSNNITGVGTNITSAAGLTIATSSSGDMNVQPNGSGYLRLGTTGTGAKTLGNNSSVTDIYGSILTLSATTGTMNLSVSSGTIKLGAISAAGTVRINSTTDLASTGVTTIGNATGGVAFEGQVSMGGYKISNLAQPTADNDAARKVDVDRATLGLDAKDSVRVATAAALPASTYHHGSSSSSSLGSLSSEMHHSEVGAYLIADVNASINDTGIDGITDLIVGTRVLVKDQADGMENGIYTITDLGSGASPWILTRATDFDDDTTVTTNAFMFTEEGATNHDKGFILTTHPSPIDVGIRSLDFTLFSNPGGGLTEIVQDLTPQLGGNLDVNGKDITSVSNGYITVQPNGSGALYLNSGNTGVTVIGNATGLVQLGGNLNVNAKTITSLSNGAVSVQPNGSGGLNLCTTGTGLTIIGNATGFVRLGGDLQVNGKNIVSLTNGAIAVQPDGSGALNLCTTGTGATAIGNATGTVTVTRLLCTMMSEAFTGNDTLTAAESGKLLDNDGAAGQVNLTLPAAAAGLVFEVVVAENQILRLVPTTDDTIRLEGTESDTGTNGGYVEANVKGNALRLVAVNATEWVATSVVGTWSVNTA